MPSVPKPENPAILVRVGEDIKAAVIRAADLRDQAVTQWVRQAIREKLEREAGRVL